MDEHHVERQRATWQEAHRVVMMRRINEEWILSNPMMMMMMTLMRVVAISDNDGGDDGDHGDANDE